MENQQDMVSNNNNHITNEMINSLQILAQMNPTAEQLSFCQDKINQLMNRIDIMSHMIALLENSESNIIKLITTQIGAYLRLQKNSHTRKHNPNIIHQQLQSCFMKNTLSKDVKLLIQHHYTEFIYAHHNLALREQCVKQLCEHFGKYNLMGNSWGNFHLPNEEFIANMNQMQVQELLNYIHIVSAVYVGPIDSGTMRHLTKQIYGLLVIMAQSLAQKLAFLLQCHSQNSYQETKKGVNQLSQLSALFKLMFIKADIDQLITIKEDMIRMPKTNQLLLAILSLKFINGNSLTTAITAHKQNQQMCKIIDELKITAMEIIYNLGRILHKKKYFNNVSANHVPLQTCRKVLTVVGHTLVQEFQTFTELYLPNNCERMYKSIMKTISTLIKIPLLYCEAEKLAKNLLFGICIPLLMIKPQQSLMSAQDYINKREDIPNSQTMNLLQNSVGKILEAYCDHIDGSVSQLVRVCINSISFHLTANPMHFQQLPQQLLQTYFWNNANHLQQIQTALTVMTILSYMGTSREDIIILIEEFTMNTCPFFCNIEHPPSLHIAFILFYTYYLDNFYQLILKNNPQSRKFHQQILKYLTQLIQHYYNAKTQQYRQNEIGKAVVLQAIDCISNSLNQSCLFKIVYYDDLDAELFVQLINYLLSYIYSPHNVISLETIYQFLLQHIRVALKTLEGLNALPPLLRNYLMPMIALKLYASYDTSFPNHSLLKIKISQLIYILLFAAIDIFLMFDMGKDVLLRCNQCDCESMINCTDILMRKSLKAQLTSKNLDLLNSICICVGQYIPLIIRQNLLGQSLGILTNLSILRIGAQSIVRKVIDIMIDMLDLVTSQNCKRQYNNLSAEEVEMIIEKLLFLLIMNAYRNYELVNFDLWRNLLGVTYKLCNFIPEKAVGSRNIMGKIIISAISILCKISTQQLQPILIETVWRRMLVCDKIYTTKWQKKVLSLILIHQLQNSLIQSKLQGIFQGSKQASTYCLISKLIFNLRNQQSYEDYESISDDQDFEDGWKPKPYTLQNNEFINNVGDQVLLLRDMSLKYAQFYPQQYRNMLQLLPSAIKSFIKSKVLLYKPIESQEQQLRKIYRIKKDF